MIIFFKRQRSIFELVKLMMAMLYLAHSLNLSAQEKSFSQIQFTEIEELKKQAPRVYLDCGTCDFDYIRTEITFVNYVRDRKEAQIYILVTTQRTGSGGREYTLSFMGQQDFQGVDVVHRYFSSPTDTEEEIRDGLSKAIKIGLMTYMGRTPLRRHLTISFLPERPAESRDKWNSWVFNIRGYGSFRGESNYRYESLSTTLSANRTTAASKIKLSFYYGQNRNFYKYDDLKISSRSQNSSLTCLYVFSLDEHWSIGGFLDGYSSTYENIKSSFNLAPAIEYNFFPYSVASRKQLRLLYRLHFITARYREETIYDKIKENLAGQSLALTLELREKVGTISVALRGSHYFHDFRKNRLTLYGMVNLFLFKGFSFYVLGSGSRIHDQLSLAKGGASLEEILLRRRQMETSYQYFISIGLSYTFGSLFANVVNPRFGSEGGGGIRIEIN